MSLFTGLPWVRARSGAARRAMCLVYRRRGGGWGGTPGRLWSSSGFLRVHGLSGEVAGAFAPPEETDAELMPGPEALAQAKSSET